MAQQHNYAIQCHSRWYTLEKTGQETNGKNTDNKQTKHLKMIGKGFVLFKINSSPSAFYMKKPTCIS